MRENLARNITTPDEWASIAVPTIWHSAERHGNSGDCGARTPGHHSDPGPAKAADLWQQTPRHTPGSGTTVKLYALLRFNALKNYYSSAETLLLPDVR
jgi:hypothetical protein